MDYVNKGFIFEVHPFSPFRLIVKLREDKSYAILVGLYKVTAKLLKLSIDNNLT